MGYWDSMNDNSFSIINEGGGSSSLDNINNYFSNTQLRLLDEWLEEDKLLLNEADEEGGGIGEFASSVGSWIASAPGSLWNWTKGLVTGTGATGKAIRTSTIGNLADKAIASAKDNKAVVNGVTLDTSKMSGGLAGWIKSLGGKNPNGTDIQQGISGYANKLGDWMRNNPNGTTAGLAAAGLLGIYYIYRKWKNNKNKKPDAATIQHAVQLDQKSPNNIPPQERNQPVQA